MADETTVKFLYPPNFKGSFNKDEKGVKRYSILCTNYSDGTGEDLVIKASRQNLWTTEGGVPLKLVVEKIIYDISGMTVRVSYNNENDEEVAVLFGSEGTIDYTPQGGFTPEDQGDNDGGDVCFTTLNHTAGDSYTITLVVRPKW